MKFKTSKYLNGTFWIMFSFFISSADVWARAGGGKSGGGGILGIIFFPISLIYAWYVNQRITARTRKIEKILEEMQEVEPQWSEANLLGIAQGIFVQTQDAWGTQDLGRLSKLLHPALLPSWTTALNDQRSMSERNPMVGLTINQMRIVDAQNYALDELDSFTVCFDAQGEDQTIVNNEIVSKNSKPFREFWTFHWHNGAWMLFEVIQAAGWRRFIHGHLVYERSKDKRAS